MQRAGFVEYLLERPDVAPVWHNYTNHPFVQAMADGSLPLESFKGYLIQYVSPLHRDTAHFLSGRTTG